MLKWVFANPDTGLRDTFDLEANGAVLSSLEYLSPNFKLVDADLEFFDAYVEINEAYGLKGSFEWRAGTLSHKIAEKIQDKTVKSFKM